MTSSESSARAAFAYKVALFGAFLVAKAYVSTFDPIRNTSNSMKPLLKRGTLAFLDHKHVDVHDVVAFRDEEHGGIIVHKVASVDIVNGQEELVTYGIANMANDTRALKRENIVGRMALLETAVLCTRDSAATAVKFLSPPVWIRNTNGLRPCPLSDLRSQAE